MTTSTLKNQKAPLWLLLLFFVSFGSVAQTEYLNTTVNYTNTNAASWISTYGGTAKWMMDTNTLGTGSSVNITWNNTGNFTFVCKYSGVTPWSSFPVTDYTIQTYYVFVLASPPTPNATFTSSATCSSVTVSQTNPVSSGEKYEWWWQTSPTGATTGFGNSSSFTLNANGNLYLRARLKISPYTWSDNLQSLGYFSLYTPPTVPTVQNVSLLYNTSTTLTANGAGANETYRWYIYAYNPMFMYVLTLVGTGNTYNTSPLLENTTYYVSKFNSSTNCESPTVPLVVNLYLNPPTQLTTSVNTCGAKTITFSEPPTWDVIYFWQGTNPGGTDTSTPVGTTYTIDATGNFYVRARVATTGLWSGAVKITSFVDPVDITLNEYTPVNSLVQATHSITLANGFTATATASNTFNARILITSECNDLVNWTEQIAYDQNGNPVGRSKAYQDGFGNNIQNQSIDYVNNKVWTSQPIFDQLNNPSANTLSAPILAYDFVYKNNFVQNQAGQIYSANDFDLPVNNNSAGEINNPKAVGNAPGTLGWYYSSANNLEPKTPATAYPYSRSYTPPGPNPTTSKSAGVGENNKMGSGHETQGDKYLFGSSVLAHYGLVRPAFTTNTSPLVGYMSVGTDPNGKKAATFTDADGRTLASAIIVSGTSPSNFAYTDWSYTFYNDVGQVVASVAPQGINTVNNTITQYITYYKYDHLGRLIETTSPDEGTSRFVYSTDGKIRFSENQEQRSGPSKTPPVPARFSYTNYDYLGRLIESGEYESTGTNPYVFEPHSTAAPVANSVLNIVDNVGFVGLTSKNDYRCKEANFIQYDVPASDYPTDAQHPAQTYTIGQVTRTSNDNTTTWYNYDEFGQLTTMRQALPFGQPQSVQWTNLLNVNVNGNSLNNSNGSGGYWADRAFSVNAIPALTDGYLEFKAGSMAGDFVLGLSAIDGATYYTINYGMLLQGGSIYAVENNNGGSTPRATYSTSDVLRIERIGSTIYFKKNGATFYTSTIPSASQLFADCNFNTVGGSITNIAMGYANFSGLSSVQWTNLANVSQLSTTLKKTGSTDVWDGGAFSIQSIPANSNGYIEFSAGEITTSKVLGLSPSDGGTSFASIAYGVYMGANAGDLRVLENGTDMGYFGSYTPSDLLRVERQGTTVTYKKNGAVFYTSLIPSNTELFGDAAFAHLNGTITNITLKVPNGQNQNILLPMQWGSQVAVNQIGSTLTKTATTAYWGDAGAFSAQAIPANSNGWIEFMAGEMGTYKMMGLSPTNADANYNTISYALFPAADGNLYVYENGNMIYNAGAFSISDVFRVEREGSTISYKKNGGTFYTSTVATTAALYGDCSFYTQGSSFKNISLGLPITVKTIDYTYDYFGNVTQVAYQAGQTDAFFHHYEYDKANRLVNAYTSLDGATKSLQAKYLYYLHGPLKRVELGGNVQGIDYVYNIDGSLKLINHPDPGQDPGNDGPNGFKADLFGMALDYNSTDYVGAGYNPGTFALGGTDQYGGAVKAQRWHSQVDSHTPRAYTYGYDGKYQLTTATFGNVTGGSGSYGYLPSAINAYQENIGGYDKNGNIQSLSRKNKLGSSIANFGYSYTTGTNQLSSVTDNGSPLLTYQYNTIGQMTQQTEGSNTMKVSYTAYGLTKEIRDGSNNLKVAFAYDDRGNRVKKTSYNASGAVANITYYVSDAAGNTLAIYEQDVANNGAMTQTEVPVYAAGRVGVYKPPFQTVYYEVDDHLGNVRGVVGKPMTIPVTATYETANWLTEQQQFVRTESARRINATLFDHTKTSGAGYSQRLSGSANEKYGLARPIAVLPGDVINAEVYVKYVDPNTNNWTAALATLMTQIAAGNSSVVIDGAGYTNPSTFPYIGLNGTSNSTGTGPKAYLNWLVFDKNYTFNPSLSGYMRMGTSAKENGTNVAHERLYSPNITITEPGFVYIYISNEEATPIDVFFDDLKVTQNMSDIVAGADYYPFGLPIPERELIREPYRYGYQGQFSEKDKETDFNFFDLRMYDARIGRWVSPDPYGQYASAYVGMGNRPNLATDPTGGFAWPFGFGSADWFKFMDFVETLSVTGGTSIPLPSILVTASKEAATSSVTSRILSSVSTQLSKAISFTAGVGDAMKSNMSLGVIEETDPNTQANASDYASGQKFGRYASIVVGAAEVAAGYLTATGGGAATLTGAGAVVGVPAVAGGLALAGHGGGVAVYSWNNLNKVHHVNSSGTGSSSSSGGFKRPKSNLSGKEGAKDVPDWAKGNKPKINENGDKFARRLLDEKYGKGNYQTGPTSEFSKIKKWGDRAFE